MGILQLFADIEIIFFCGEKDCDEVENANCIACDSSLTCIELDCKEGWSNPDSEVSNGCEHSTIFSKFTFDCTPIQYCFTAKFLWGIFFVSEKD